MTRFAMLGSMTKMQLKYDLLRPLDDKSMDSIARVHSVYGIQRVLVDPGMKSITVEYDATRLNPLEVEAALQKAGIPLGLHT
ncbi:MAG TPA: heavy-metal-associated domain-containing protein [Bryobacteraceae bacterium]|nr:heavy-metal-associated domain-containing protein [Bryobacteraceae bacterium]